MVAEPAVSSSTDREPRPSHQNQQWAVQLCNTASFFPAAQTVLKIVEIRKNRVQKTVRGTQVKLINEVDTTQSRRDQRQGFSEPRVAGRGRGGVLRQAKGDEELKLGRLVGDPTEQELPCDSEVCAIGLEAARRILGGADAILAITRAKVSARKLEAEAGPRV